jgi:glycosyltransferase involved in cell wall biosynthesis
MRLLHITPTYLPATRYGGPIFAVHGLCRALAARGHTVEVFTTSIDGPDDSAVPLGVPVVRDGVAVRYFASRILRRLAFAPELGRSLDAAMRNADIVHLHSVFLWPTWVGARFAQNAEVPYVISPRGMLVGRLIRERHQLLKSTWIALIEKSNLRHASAVHVTSNAEKAELEKFGWPLRRIAMIPNGVDAASAAAEGEPSDDVKTLAQAQPLILFLGRLAWVKGLERLLRAFARTRHGVLAIVGTDYENLAPRLTALARELGIASRVRIVPRTVTGADKELAFASARAVVLPSYSESFGNVVIEAMQRGVPVVVTPEVGAAEAVRESDGGIVADGDEVLLAAAIDRLAEDAALARTMGDAGRRHVEAHYGWPSVAARMEALYASLLRRRGLQFAGKNTRH